MKILTGVISFVVMMFINSAALIGAEAKGHDVAAKAITDGVIVHQAPDDKSPTVATLKKVTRSRQVTARARTGKLSFLTAKRALSQLLVFRQKQELMR